MTDVHTRVPPSRLETRVTVPGEHPLTYLVPVRVAVIIIISSTNAAGYAMMLCHHHHHQA